MVFLYHPFVILPRIPNFFRHFLITVAQSSLILTIFEILQTKYFLLPRSLLHRTSGYTMTSLAAVQLGINSAVSNSSPNDGQTLNSDSLIAIAHQVCPQSVHVKEVEK